MFTCLFVFIGKSFRKKNLFCLAAYYKVRRKAYIQPFLIMRNKQQLSYSDYEKRIAELCENRKIKVSIIGKSIMDRNVHKLEIGAGEKKIVLLGGVCGESEVCETLLSFAEEFIKAQEEGKRPCGTNPAYVSRYRGLVIYPLINPDALEYRCSGVNDDNPIKKRLISKHFGIKN